HPRVGIGAVRLRPIHRNSQAQPLAKSPMDDARARRSTALTLSGNVMSPHPRRSGVAAALFATLALAGCSGGATVNKPLSASALSQDANGPISQGGYRIASLEGNHAPELL